MALGRLQRVALVCALAIELREQGSWCGETHLQKASFLLEEGRSVPLHYKFVLYKYGPFSFDSREELQEMRADGLLALEPQPYPYGPRIQLKRRGERLLDNLPRTLDTFNRQRSDVVEFVGSKGVSALERLATGVYLVRKSLSDPDEQFAQLLREVKPHVSTDSAFDGIRRARSSFS